MLYSCPCSGGPYSRASPALACRWLIICLLPVLPALTSPTPPAASLNWAHCTLPGALSQSWAVLLPCCAVVPRDSAWFYFYNGSALLTLEEQPIYKEDWIGLRRLDEAGGLIFERAPGEHMQFSLAWFRATVMDKYLRGSTAPPGAGRVASS